MYMAVFVIGGILIFPIITSLYFFVDFNAKKFYFAIYLFGLIKVFNGYVKVRDLKSVYLHASNNKAYIIDLTVFKNMQSGANYFNVIIER